MKFFRRAILVSLLTLPAACGGGGGGGGGGSSSPPPPPGPPLPVITGPSSPLAPSVQGLPFSTIQFAGTVTGAFQWSVTGGNPPPGLGLSATGSYSGTPTVAGSYTFTVTLTDANGSDSNVFTHDIVVSVPEVESNDISADSTSLPSGRTGTGNLGSDDVDFWSFSATANQVIEVAVFATRRDFDSWQTNVDIPRISIIGPNGTSFLAGIDFFAGSSTGWYGAACDLDIPRFRIPANGTYFVMIDHNFSGIPGGDYALRISVLALGVLQVETEGNNSTGAANAITPGTIRAMKVDDDDDFFTFSISEPTIVYFEVWAYRNGLFGVGGVPDDDYFDPLIELIGPDGTTVLASNDDVFMYDPALHFLLVTSGNYYLRVTESTFPTDGDAEYYVTFTATPVSSGITETEGNDDPSAANPIAYGALVSGTVEAGVDDFDFFSFSGSAGDMVRVSWFELGTHETAADITDVLLTTNSAILTLAVDYAAVDRMSCVRAILPADGTYYVAAFAFGVLTDYTFRLELVKTAEFEVEANNTTGTADAIPGGGIVAGVVDSSGDVDVYSFQAAAGEVVNFSIHAAAGFFAGQTGIGYTSTNDYGSLLLPNLEIVNASGLVQAASPFAGPDFSGESMTSGLATLGITFRAPASGTFYVRVSASDSTGDADHLYILEID